MNSGRSDAGCALFAVVVLIFVVAFVGAAVERIALAIQNRPVCNCGKGLK